MKTVVNGNPMELDDKSNLTGLLETFGIDGNRAVVEVNGEIIERTLFCDTLLCEGDRVEIVRFVGGG